MFFKKINTTFNFLYYKFLSSKQKAIINGVTFGKNCIIAKSVDSGTEPYLITIGDEFYSSENIRFITHDGSVNVLRNLYEEYKKIDYLDKILIGNNVFLGIDVVVLPGVKIGNNVIVGAKSLVKGELKSNCVYAGTPAKFICTIDEYIEKNKNIFMNTKNLSYEEKKEFLLNNYDKRKL